MIYILDDQVYQPDNSLLEEYVLNDTGKIYIGNRRQIHGKKWNFGQVKWISVLLRLLFTILVSLNLSMVTLILQLLWKESLNIDGRQFQQYQQNEQSLLTLNHWT